MDRTLRPVFFALGVGLVGSLCACQAPGTDGGAHSAIPAPASAAASATASSGGAKLGTDDVVASCERFCDRQIECHLPIAPNAGPADQARQRGRVAGCKSTCSPGHPDFAATAEGMPRVAARGMLKQGFTSGMYPAGRAHTPRGRRSMS